MSWAVTFTSKAERQKAKLPQNIVAILAALVIEFEKVGPIRGNWKNYGKLGAGEHHCHLKSGRPTYVACWRIFKNKKIVEVYYVGTHEKAPY